MTRLRKWMALAACLVLGGAAILLYSHRSHSPASEQIQYARAADTPYRIRDLVQSRRPLEPARWKELLANTDESLHLGTADIEWSPASFNAGYLYFHKPGYMPRRMVWEFAPCTRTNLSEIMSADMAGPFHNANSPEGAAAFGAKWRGESIYMMPGDTIFARLSVQTNTIYALQIREQTGAHGEQVRVAYRTFTLP